MGRPLVDDPFPLYQQLRAQAPVHREPNGLWYLSRFADCERVLRSPGFGHGPSGHAPAAAGRRMEILSRMFSFDDPPEHTRKRGLVTAPFTASATASYRPRLTALVDELLASVRAGVEVDIDAVVSAKLPVVVTSELIGIPPADHERCAQWVDRMTSSNQLVLTGEEGERILAEADVAAGALADYFTDLMAARRDEPRDDILSHLASVAATDPRVSTDDVVATLVLLLAAGFETTRYTITGGLLALAERPDQWSIARAQAREGELTNDAVEELLRHQGPIHASLARHTDAPTSFGDVTVPAGEPVVLLLAAANRDPEVFADPDRLDLTRAGQRPLSFGAGAHYCLGAFLARDEIRFAIGEIVRRFAGLEVVEHPVPKGSFNVRGPKSLRVKPIV